VGSKRSSRSSNSNRPSGDREAIGGAQRLKRLEPFERPEKVLPPRYHGDAGNQQYDPDHYIAVDFFFAA
jgi:hypothetical protein